MLPRPLIIGPLVASFVLPAFGCGLFRRRNQVNSTVNSSVEVNSQGRDIATLSRDEYEIIETSVGESKHTGVLLLTIPVGQQTTTDEGIENAYYAAVDRVPECDALLMPRVSVKRIVIPLLLVNIVIRKARVKGRCAHFKGERGGVANERGFVAAPEGSQEPEEIEPTESPVEPEAATEPAVGERDPA